MSRLAPFDPALADGRRKELLDEVQANFGATPNLFRTAAQSETALAAMLEMFQTINGGTLGPQLVEKIAIAVAGDAAGEQLGCVELLPAERFHRVAPELPNVHQAVAGSPTRTSGKSISTLLATAK